ncbi:MAG: transporter [Alistipes sp.]|nr:transporter [Alistipes sp.]
MGSIRRVLFIVVAMAVTANVMAQEVEFTADRPGVSTGPTVIGHRVVQLEQGVQYDGDGGHGQFTFSNTLLRYGLFEGVELRLGGDGFIHHDGSWQAAFSGLSVGTKIRCFEGRNALPAVSLMANLAVPYTGSRGFVVEHLAPSLYILFENPVNEWLSIGYNVGAEWDGAQPAPQTFVALCLGFTLTEQVGCFVESYNNFARHGNAYGVDFGFNYMISDSVQLDAAANLDLCHPAQCWSISLGVAWQINRVTSR